jgi:hypothetical protein
VKSSVAGNVNAFTSGEWPAVSFVVPDCLGLMVHIGIHTTGLKPNGGISVFARLTGPGISYPTGQVDFTPANYQHPGYWDAHGTESFIPRGWLTVGQQVTATPYYQATGSGATTMEDGRFDIIAMGV